MNKSVFIPLNAPNAKAQQQTMRTIPLPDALDTTLLSSNSTSAIPRISDEERRAARLARFGQEEPEETQDCDEDEEVVDFEMIMNLPLSDEMKEGKRLTVLLPASVVQGRLSLDQRNLGSDNWDLIDPLNLDMIRAIRAHVQPILYPKSNKVAMLEPVKNLEDLELLIYRNHFGSSSKENDRFERATRWAKQMKHALYHQDFVYLLFHGHCCLSAVVVIANMIERKDLANAALQLLCTAGYQNRCSLPYVVPQLYVKCCCGKHM